MQPLRCWAPWDFRAIHRGAALGAGATKSEDERAQTLSTSQGQHRRILPSQARVITQTADANFHEEHTKSIQELEDLTDIMVTIIRRNSCPS